MFTTNSCTRHGNQPCSSVFHLSSSFVWRLSAFRTLLHILPLKNGFLFLLVESNKNLQTNNALMFFFSRLPCKKTSITYIKVASCLLYCFKLLVLKHLCAAEFQPEDSIQIHVTESKEPLSPRFSPGLQPQPPSRFNFLPLALRDMEIHVCIRKERDSALGAEDSKGGENQYCQAMLGRCGVVIWDKRPACPLRQEN